MVNEASIEAKEEESVWQSGDCQSKASKKSGLGLSNSVLEKAKLEEEGSSQLDCSCLD